MKIYGHTDSIKTETSLELDEVAICFHTTEEAMKFAEFALSCAKDMERYGDNWDHEHFVGGEVPDITINRLYDANR